MRIVLWAVTRAGFSATRVLLCFVGHLSCALLSSNLWLCAPAQPSGAPPRPHGVFLPSLCFPLTSTSMEELNHLHQGPVPSLLLSFLSSSLPDTYSSAVSFLCSYKYSSSVGSSLIALNMLTFPHSYYPVLYGSLLILSDKLPERVPSLATSPSSTATPLLAEICLHCVSEIVLIDITHDLLVHISGHVSVLILLTPWRHSTVQAISPLWNNLSLGCSDFLLFWFSFYVSIWHLLSLNVPRRFFCLKHSYVSLCVHSLGNLIHCYIFKESFICWFLSENIHPKLFSRARDLP